MQKNPQDPEYEKVNRISAQVIRMGEITQKLMGINRYETKDYPMGKIVGIDRSSGEESLRQGK